MEVHVDEEWSLAWIVVDDEPGRSEYGEGLEPGTLELTRRRRLCRAGWCTSRSTTSSPA